MIDLLRAEFLKLRSTRTALGLFIITLIVSVVPTILLVALAPREVLDSEEAGSFFNVAASLVPYVVLVFGILGMTNEYRHGTITYTYVATPRRGRVMIAKLVVYALVGAAMMLVAIVLVQLTARMGLQVRGIGYQSPEGMTLADPARQVVVAGLMTAFGVSLGALLRAQVPTVAGVLIWAFAVESIIAMVRPKIGVWLPFTVFNQVIGGNIGGAESSSGLERPEAFLVSVVYIGIVSVAAVLISMSRDVT
ncbi:MAG TPA: ABC transporter permease [Thermoleophilia bacterium]|nr:ABC transporter permease [Thermoleophilia bacterium]